MDLAHPVFRFAYQGNVVELSNLLSQDPRLINRPDYDGNMPLHLAALSGSTHCVQICLDVLERRSNELNVQTEVQRQNFLNRDAACCAVISGSVDCVQLLFDAGARTDYRFTSEVPILMEAIKGSNVQVLRLVLDSIDTNFESGAHGEYWFTALKQDLFITLEYYKLFKAHAVPYGMGIFEELYLRLIEYEPSTPGLEEILTYLCTDAVDRWSKHGDGVLDGLFRVTSFFLRKLVPQVNSMEPIHRFQQHGLLEPPRSALAWLRVINEWGIPFVHIEDTNVQDRLLFELSKSNYPVPLIHDPSLLPLVLYFAILSLKFPRPGWLSSWIELCQQVGHAESSLATLFELHTVRNSRSAGDFFWCEVFPLVVLRTIEALKYGIVCLSIAHQELERFVDQILSHCPSMRPGHIANRDNLLFKVLSSFPASNNAPAHPLFITVISNYILPWISQPLSLLTHPHGLMTSTVHVLSHRTLLETIVDYSPAMALYLLSNLRDWPHRAHSHLNLLAESLLLSYIETCGYLVLPSQLGHLLAPHSMIPGSTTAASVSHWLQDWFNRVREEPFRLRTLAKLQTRLTIRQVLQTQLNGHRKPLSNMVYQLPLPHALQTFIVNSDLV